MLLSKSNYKEIYAHHFVIDPPDLLVNNLFQSAVSDPGLLFFKAGEFGLIMVYVHNCIIVKRKSADEIPRKEKEKRLDEFSEDGQN